VVSHAYAIDSMAAERRVLAALGERFSVVKEPSQTRRVTYYDTFDWRLYRDESVLTAWSQDGGNAVAWRGHDGALRHRWLSEIEPAFARDLPPGPCRQALERRIEMRRLLPLARADLRASVTRVLDGNRKTVARVIIERGSAAVPEAPEDRRRLPGTLRLVPVRGYAKATRKIAELLGSQPGLTPVEPGALPRVLAVVDRKPPAAVPPLTLEPSMRADVALVAILRRNFDAMRRNVQGVLEDLDSEFLHDFRVAVRRTRSALGQLKRVLPPEQIGGFRGEFKWLGDITGPTRDLDVYLLELPRYRAALPEALRRDLDPLERFLAERQREEHARLAQGLRSKRYERLTREWEVFLDRPRVDQASAPDGPREVRLVASRRIARAHRRVMAIGGDAGADADAQLLHRLRIECKKLRYLLEFFSSLYPRDEIGPFVRKLKKLQDTLGTFNDLDTQRQSLATFAREMGGRDLAGEETLMALGRLVDRLEQEQHGQRAVFETRFAAFAAKACRERFRSLFGKTGAGG
jgi:CHAD domain-containing protein